MKYGNNTNKFGFNGILFNMEEVIKNKSFTGKKSVNSSVLFYLITIGLSILFLTESVNGQFLVQPGVVSLELKPRQMSEGVLKIHNYDPNNEVEVWLKVMELTQKENGDWLPFTTDPCNPFDYYPGLDMSKVSSCSSWVKLETDKIIVPKDADVALNYSIKTPPQARAGFYGATIMASSVMTFTDEKIDMLSRTGIPVIANLNIGTRPDKVEIEDLGMSFLESVGPTQGKVILSMKIKNDGITFPRLRPIIRVRGFIGDHWRIVTTHEFNESAVIPGAEITLRSDIGKSLPSGKYQLDGVLYVDGSISGRGKRFGKEINFEGDPLITKVATDVPLDLDPREVIISTNPGSTRYGDISIHNAADEVIQIYPVLGIPQSFQGKAKDNVIIQDAMTCLKWLSFVPQTLLIPNYQTRNFKIAANMPEDAGQYPYYYAALGLKVVYPDGQVAGTKWVNLCLENPNATSTPNIKLPMIDLTEINEEQSLYAVKATFVNSGTSHIIPEKVKAAVAKADGFGWTSVYMSSDKYGVLLPYEERFYQGILNFSNVAPDNYNLEVIMEYSSNKTFSKQVRIKVTGKGSTRIPEILEQNLKSNELVTVHWQ